MTNKEIDNRLRRIALEIPRLADSRIAENNGPIRTRTDIELEVLNAQIMAVWTMLGEIAKRLPEV